MLFHNTKHYTNSIKYFVILKYHMHFGFQQCDIAEARVHIVLKFGTLFRLNN